LERERGSLIEDGMQIYLFLSLFVVVIFISLYDLKYRKVPNEMSLPLLLIGFTVGFPGNPVLWIGSVFILQAWKSGVIGGGDAKLWVGLLWCLFSFFGESILFVMSISLMGTGLAQLLVRALTRRKIETGVKLPGAWRTVVFMGCLAYSNFGKFLVI
jgi:Flp pilus assembly protein protease CpaA